MVSVNDHRLAKGNQTKQTAMNWMAFNNHRRLNSTLFYLSRMRYERRWYEAQRKKATLPVGEKLQQTGEGQVRMMESCANPPEA